MSDFATTALNGWNLEESDHLNLKQRIKLLRKWQLQKIKSKKDNQVSNRHKNHVNSNDEKIAYKKQNSFLPKIEYDQNKLLSIQTIDLDPSNRNRYKRNKRLSQFSRYFSKQTNKSRRLQQLSMNNKVSQIATKKKKMSPAVRKMYVQFKGREEMNSYAQKSLSNYLTERQSMSFKQQKKIFQPIVELKQN